MKLASLLVVAAGAGLLAACSAPHAQPAGGMGPGPHAHGGMGPDGPRGAMMQDMFAKMDRDHDGKVTKAEIAAARAERFAAMDTNKDGVVTVDEMLAHREQMRRQHMQAMLERMDANKDGKVTAEEFAAAAPMNDMFARMDRNSDGVLTPDEFAGPMGRGPGGHGHHGRMGGPPPRQ